MQAKEPMFNVCHSQIFLIENVALKDGLNNLTDPKHTIKIFSLYNGEVHLILNIRLDNLDECPTPRGHTMYYIIGGIAGVLGLGLLVSLAYWFGCKNQNPEKEEEIVDMNPEYGGEDYERDNEIKDTNDYYFYAKPGDKIEITDTNEYYD